MYLKRNLQDKINQQLKFFPVVILIGGRQCGKTTLARQVRKKWSYYDLENPNHFDLIDQDPVLFFSEHKKHTIIDEAQKSPKLFETLRGVVDENRNLKGRFILTGSSSFDLLKNITESLAGRVAIIEVPPLKFNEFEKKEKSAFYSIFKNEISDRSANKIKKLEPIIDISKTKQYLLNGGYPEPVLSRNPIFLQQWMENYFSTYINRDMRELFPRIDTIKYRRFVSMLSYLSGTILNKSEISRSIEVSERSVRDYLDILAGTFFWRQLESYKTSKVKTTLKLPKGYFRDVGLCHYLQKITTIEQLETNPCLGKSFETFVIEEIISGIRSLQLGKSEFYHFRTKKGSEVDLVIEGPFGILPVEIKYGSHTSKKQIQPLINFVEVHDLPLGLVVNNSDKVKRIADKIIEVPVGML